MDSFEDRYYRDSGAVPIGGTILMLACGIITAVVLGCVYAFLNCYNPFVYVTFLGTAFFGLVTGGAVTFGSMLGKVRNPFFTRLVGLFVGVLALYCCWAFYLWAVLDVELTFDTTQMLSRIQFINSVGVWTMFGGKPTGWILYALWAVEALIIVGAAVLVAGGSDAPFCEPCNEWTDEAENLLSLEKADFEELRDDLEAERYSRLNELHTGEHDNADCLRVTLHTCPKCDESNYLSIQHVVVTLDKDGDEQSEETDVVKRLLIPAELVGHLQTAAENVPTRGEPEEPDEPGNIDDESSIDPAE